MVIFGKFVEVVDLVSLGLVLVLLIRGIFKGFVWQVAGVTSLVGGMIAASKLTPKFAPVLHENFSIFREQENSDVITAYFLIFVGFMIVVLIAARLLKGLIDRLKLNSYDKLLGGLFGGIKAVALIVLVVSVLSMFESAFVNDRIAKAYTGKVADFAVEKSGPLFPDEIKNRVRSTMASLRGEELPAETTTPAGEAPADAEGGAPAGPRR